MPVLLRVQKERETSLQATSGAVCAVPVHPPAVSCLHTSRELLHDWGLWVSSDQGQCVLCLCTVLFAAVPFGTAGAAQSSVWDQLPSGCRISRHGSSVEVMYRPSSPTLVTLQQLWSLHCSHSPAAVTAHICAFPVSHSFVLQSLLMAPNQIKAALAGGCAHTVRHS